MKARLVVVAVVLAGLGSPVVIGGQQDTPTFRAHTTVVTVPVSVRQGNNPVAGLRASDFELTDNGVTQELTRVTFEEVPIDVTLLLDVSESTSRIVERMRRDAQQIMNHLRATDRIRILAIGTYVHELVALRTHDGLNALPAAPEEGGLTSFYDALAAALATRADPNRRRLVVAISDGVDTSSINDVNTIRELARRSDSVLHIVLVVPPHPDPSATTVPTPSPQRSLPSASARPVDGDNGRTLETAARDTGGAVTRDGARSTPNPVEIFKRVFDEFRQSYVLSFTPSGVSSVGWHELQVRVRNVPAKGVRPRAGYFAN